ncbi:amino acid adenylation domain-containing protein [Streptomyces phaeoluteigriseus]|uniref:Amino acid adenylation domain-containing protein n=1 Tax=Streptomyces phaeoluteigriseus TaxID=114686 RepID=A0ABY4ZGG1_9ACTN|nr:amino acid adenylation domain-containing protein [Streptomyces phaeoluteigriseus]USQ87991.1 amino acid adenylation domain-containing protein [Streptomyces phaeoluteigriseus]
MTAPARTTFVEDIRAHADRAPHSPALLTAEGPTSYGELAARIDRLAARLVAHGVGPERVCAVALPAGADAVVATAAVVRAGGAFLTLDTDLPGRRLAALAAGAAHLLTCASLADRLRPLVDAPAVLLDRLPAADRPPAGFRAPHPRSLAYVSHTSGSTGTPNPVLVEHGGLDTYLRGVVRDNALGPGTVALQLAPPGYDASIRDTFAPLAAGGCVVLVERSRLLRADSFADTVAEYGVDTLLSTTPSFLGFLAQSARAVRRLRSLRLVCSSGESLRPFLAAGGRALIGGRLVNQYGPSECTMTSTRYDVPAAPGTSADIVGTAIDGTVVRLLDPRGREVPDGRTGEVYIGGAGVARGYGGQPALTADRFPPDPYGPPGTRLYRTGDLARRAPDGTLEYLGRADRQVKIRGHRVDPAEIEGALLVHPEVTGAVVTAETDDRGRTWLGAHVTGPLEGTTDAQLRAHLARTLPPHMMPRRFTRLERLPVTHSGKADRRALRATAPEPVS